MKIIEVSNLKKNYGEYEVLRGIDFSMEQGEILSIIGKSGSGKTTLINILGTLEKQSSGQYLFAGEDISSLSEKERCRKRSSDISMIYQDYNVFESLNAEDNILLPFLFNKKKYDKDFYATLLDELDIKELMHKKTGVLSGGEKQRIAIARAMLLKPQVILADEPTGNLDSYNTDVVINALMDCARLRNQAVIVVTHDMDVARKTNRIMMIKDGRIEQCGE